MTYAPQTATTTQTGMLGRLKSLRDMLRTVMEQRVIYSRTSRELQALSNRELADLGIHRSEIPRIAVEAAFKS